MRNRTAIVLLALLLIGAAIAAPALAGNPAQSGQPVTIYFFWGDGCPHCAEAEPFLADLVKRYPGAQIRDFETWRHPENAVPFARMAEKFGFEPTGVPTIFIGDRYWVGYNKDPIGKEIEDKVAACLRSGCPDAGDGVIAPVATPTVRAAAAQPKAAEAGGQPALPLGMALLVVAAVFAVVMAVLLVRRAMALRSSRGRQDTRG
jgi:thiol-disulfide isomerase/thioredoxin